jgi:hypothetical protein
VAEVVVDRIIIQVEEHLEEQVEEGKDLLDQMVLLELQGQLILEVEVDVMEIIYQVDLLLVEDLELLFLEHLPQLLLQWHQELIQLQLLQMEIKLQHLQ